MFLAESRNKATGGFCSQAHERQVAEMLYQKKSEKLLADENCMKIYVVCIFGIQFLLSAYLVESKIAHFLCYLSF